MQVTVQIGYQLLENGDSIAGNVRVYQDGHYVNITTAKNAKLIDSRFYQNENKTYQWYNRVYELPTGTVLLLACDRQYAQHGMHNAVAYLKVAGLYRKVWYAPAFSDGVWGGMCVGCLEWLKSGVELKHVNPEWNKREFFLPAK